MNSGKVRIYELSRELNLDNKDLLAICEQLDISVKSHSSTIMDADAERIRAAAETYAATHQSSKPTQTRQASNSQPMESKTKAAPVPKKQQILEIRKPIIRQATPPAPPAPPKEIASTVASKPAAPPQKPAATTPPPHRSEPENATPPVERSPLESVLPEVQPPAEIPVEPVAPPIAPVESIAPVEAAPKPSAPDVTVPDVTVSPQLIGAPERLGASAPPPRSQPPLAIHTPPPIRPVLKRAQPNSPAPARPATDPGSDRADNGDRAVGSDRVPAERPTLGGPSRVAPGVRPAAKPGDRVASRPQTIVELRRPRPVRPDDDPSARADGLERGETTSTIEPVVLLKDRPRPPAADAAKAPGDAIAKPTPARDKKGGKWREEEEDNPDFSEKAIALKAGKKRRTQTTVDEDEDIDLDALLDEDGEAIVQVSLSLVRPAKPKAIRQPQVKAPVAAVTPKSAKKTTSFRDRRDQRREQEAKPDKPEKITLMGGLTVQELSNLLLVSDTEIIRALFMKGIAATVTQTLDVTTATTVAQDFGVEVETGERAAAARKVTEMLDVSDLESLQRRPPVVTIMGHVDHGKTTLLDSIRKTRVAQGEAGGITQHIGAYHVDVEHNGKNQQVVFLDTPGHEAFTAMRARGARVTDIAILVVAADDGVQPQTIEAIRHAQAAEVPIIVAINKIDKEGAQPDRVKQELTEYGLVPEEWGGETIMVAVSAITGLNLEELLEMILLVAEVEDLHANPDRAAKGTVIEAHLDKAKGPVATLLIQNGTLRVGETLVAGSVLGKVRAMMDDRGARVKVASPSFAVEVLGLNDVPAAGDEFDVFQDEKEARSVASDRADEQRQSRLLQALSSRRVSLNTLSARAQEGDLKELNLVLKADVQGSVEAILGSLKQLPQNEVQVRVLYAAPGEVTETDVDLAAASDAVIVGFNTTLAPGARQAADQAGVDVRDYNIIYKLLDDIQAAMEGLLDPELVEESLGQVEVRAVFPVGRGSVAGCYILSGKAIRNCKVRVRRKDTVVYEGNLDSLKRMKEDAREVNAGYECGIGVDNFTTWEVGDIIEAYRMVSKRRSLTPVR